MESKKFFRTLIGAKLIVVFLSLALYQGWIQLGDLPTFAEAEKSSSKDPKTDTSNTKPSEDPEEKSASDAPKKEESQGKSFLADLFELPKLDPKSARKEEVGKYLDMADRKDRQLKEREAMLQRKEKQLREVEKSIDEKLVKMDEERKFIAKTLQQEKDLKGERLEKLISLFDKMEPKKAAPQIEKLDKDLVVGLLKGLKQKQVTSILEFMNPDKSVEITEYFGRVKSAKEYDLLKELNASLKKEFAECKGMPEATADNNASSKPSDAAANAPKKAENSKEAH
jgi:flagellar motility protein MotE (MotC chaperone)